MCVCLGDKPTKRPDKRIKQSCWRDMTQLCVSWRNPRRNKKNILKARCMPGEGSLGEIDWVPLLFTWNYHNIVNWLCAVLSRSVVSDSLQPRGLQPARIFRPWRFSRQEYCSGLPFPPPGDLPNPGIEPSSPSLQVDSLPTKPPGKAKNTGVASLSHLQAIFLVQESNQSLLHCRQILYQLS